MATACDTSAVAIFTAGLVSGTAISIVSKTLLQVRAMGKYGAEEDFAPKLLNTVLMFAGMSMSLVVHSIARRCKPTADEPTTKSTSLHLLCIPAILDLCGTALNTLGLLLLPLSLVAMLRGSVIVFAAILKQFVLGDRLTLSNWLGVAVITAALSFAGLVGAGSGSADMASGSFVTGIFFVLGGTFVNSLQFAVEEKLMSSLSAPPLLLVGMEGVTGFVLAVCVVYPIYWLLPGDDHGHFEEPSNTLSKLSHSPEAQWMALAYTTLVLLFNMMSMMITQRLSSVWKAILSNCRPASVWATQLALYGLTGGLFGEAWKGGTSWLQLGGLVMLLLGSA